jgi:hypothetical protein
MEGKVYEIGPEMAIFGPAEVPQRIEVDEKNLFVMWLFMQPLVQKKS